MILVIAEKRDMADEFASILKDTFVKKNGYHLGKKYVITWAIGHLLESKTPGNYEEFSGWNWESIPFFPPNGDLDFVKPSKTEFDKYRVKQLQVINNAYKENDIELVVNACDAEREGELIFWEIYYYLGMKKPVERLWLQSKEEKDILDAFDHLRDESFIAPRREASFARQYADWLLGNNLTVAFTVKVNNLLHIGRVQTPTLSLLVKRRLEIENFKPEDYYELTAEFGNKYTGQWYKDNKSNVKFENKEAMEALSQKIKDKPAKVISKKVEEVSEKPKGLFNLGGLQKEANSKLGFTAKKTLEVAQELYDKQKLISYPRTSSAFLLESQKDSFEPILRSLSNLEYKDHAKEVIDLGMPSGKHFVDNKKVTDHYAIIPTRKTPNWNSLNDVSESGVTKKEMKDLYDIIAKRFISVFLPAARYERTEVITEVEGETFKTSGRILIDLGWKKVYVNDKETEDDKKNKEEEKQLPMIEDGEENTVTKVNPETKQTKAPPHYNDRTLVGAMESARDYLEEDELKEELKEVGIGMELGTPATRDSIIENLINRNYAERSGRRIIATDLGVKLISVAPESLKSPEVTATWEAKLKKMENNEYSRESFKEDLNQFVRQTIEELKEREINVSFAKKAESVGECPNCGKNVIEFKLGYSCESNTKEKSCFVVWKTVSKKKLTKKHIESLIKTKETPLIKGFTSTSGKKFDAKLRLKEDGNGVEFVFPERKKLESKDLDVKCPSCDKDYLKSIGKVYKCTSCQFVIFKNIAKRDLKERELKDLLEGKTIGPFDNFVSKANKKFKAKLKFNSETKKIEFEF